MSITTNDSASIGFIVIDDQVIRYDQFVLKLLKADTFKEMVHHAKGGVCEEAGELSDAIKIHVTYGKPLDYIIEKETGQTLYNRIVEELGDVRFYLQAVMNLYGINEQQVLTYNAIKLSKRYKDLTFSMEEATNRADKVGE